MASAAAKTVFPHITMDPEVCHGRPCIAGTRVRVMDIVAVQEQGVPRPSCRIISPPDH